MNRLQNHEMKMMISTQQHNTKHNKNFEEIKSDSVLDAHNIKQTSEFSVPTISFSPSLSSSHSSPYIWRLIIIANLSLVSSGYNLCIVNTISSYFSQELNHDKSSNSLITITYLNFFFNISALFGCWIFSCLLSNILGRQIYMLLCDLFMIIGTIFSIIFTNFGYEFVIIGRILCGLATGINTLLIPLYLNEILTFSINSNLLKMYKRLFVEFSFGLGILAGLSIGLLVFGKDDSNVDFYVETKIALSIIPIAFSALRSIFIVLNLGSESPFYMIMQMEEEKARKFLVKIKDNDTEKNILTLKNAIIGNSAENTLMKMFSLKFIERMIIGLTLVGIHFLTGLPVFFFHSNIIFSFFNHVTNDPTYINIQSSNALIGLIYLISIVLFILSQVYLKIPKKLLMYIGLGVACILALIIFVKSFMISIDDVDTLIFAYMLSIAIGMGPILEAYNDNILPGKGMEITMIVKWIGYTFTSSCFEFIIEYLLLVPGFFLIMFLTTMLGFYLIIDFIPEKYMKVEEISNLFVKDTSNQSYLD